MIRKRSKICNGKILKVNSLFLAMLILTLLFSGCNNIILNSSNTVAKPVNNDIPIEGTWKITGSLANPANINGSSNTNSLINLKVSFSSKKVIFGDNKYINPKYKVRTVNTNEYFIYNYHIMPDLLKISQEKIQLISISTGNNYFYEFALVGSKELILNMDNTFYTLEKIDNLFINEDKASTASSGGVESKKKVINSALLLSLKSYRKDASSKLEEPVYRTIYISYKDKLINSETQELNYILLPRQNGFWTINSKRQIMGTNNIWDSVSAQPVDKANVNNWSDKPTIYETSSKTINFVGNDYVSFDLYNEGIYQNGENSKSSKLQVVSINSLLFSNPIKLTEILAGNGLKVFQESISSLKDSSKGKNVYSDGPDEDNWGVERCNGHWILKSRLTEKAQTDNNYSYVDFNIPLPAPKELIGYDDLYPSWGGIKDSIPEAIDAFSSPGKDIIVIVTSTKIKVYKISNGVIGKDPLKEIDLRKGEGVIMDQWATGDYVENWEKAFLSNNPKDIN